MLKFEDHWLIPGMHRAKKDGYSVITGKYVQGYEVMDPNGDVRTFSSLVKVERIISEGIRFDAD